MVSRQEDVGFQMQRLSPLQYQSRPLSHYRTDCSREEPSPCRIKRRVIERVCLKRNIKRNKNIPKNIIGSFRKLLPKYQRLYQQSSYRQVWEKVIEWHTNGFDINLWHLNELFGEVDAKSSYINRMVLRQMLSSHDLLIVGEQTKVQNILTYLVCIHQYIFRMGNGQLARRVQSK